VISPARLVKVDASPLIERATGTALIERMRQLAARIDPAYLATDPIDVFERMVGEDAAIECVPLIYGHAPEARDGFRARRIAFADMLVDGERSGERELRFPRARSMRRRRGTSTISSLAARSSAASTPSRADNPRTPTPGRTTPSIATPTISTAPRARRSNAPGCALGTTGT
jgi:hypothetical protein